MEELDLRVVPRHRDVIEAQVLVDASTELEVVYARMRFQDLNHTTRCLLKGKALQEDEVSVGQLEIDQRELASLALKNVRIGGVTDLTTKGSPIDLNARIRTALCHL